MSGSDELGWGFDLYNVSERTRMSGTIHHESASSSVGMSNSNNNTPVLPRTPPLGGTGGRYLQEEDDAGFGGATARPSLPTGPDLEVYQNRGVCLAKCGI